MLICTSSGLVNLDRFDNISVKRIRVDDCGNDEEDFRFEVFVGRHDFTESPEGDGRSYSEQSLGYYKEKAHAEVELLRIADAAKDGEAVYYMTPEA